LRYCDFWSKYPIPRAPLVSKCSYCVPRLDSSSKYTYALRFIDPFCTLPITLLLAQTSHRGPIRSHRSSCLLNFHQGDIKTASSVLPWGPDVAKTLPLTLSSSPKVKYSIRSEISRLSCISVSMFHPTLYGHPLRLSLLPPRL
jgi:hypothetical protein